ncbi:MAG TPA: class I adenylate-forming enzyme family protein [Burkholderiales bacterium]|nr:class I adenylate-forming enzyme family protein [Burkholderiales bacterium]
MKEKNLGYFFADSVKRFPDKVAIIDLHGGTERSLTYAELDARADRAGGLVRRLGVKPGERVGMIVGNRVEFLEIFFGAMRAGAIPVAINTRLARDTLKFILEDAECRAAFIDPGASAHAAEVSENVPNRVLLDAYERERDASERLKEPPRLADDAQAFQPYTSGSTGLPKGAIMTHAGMLWYVEYNQRYWPSSPQDRGLIALPLFHKNAMRGTVKPMLYAGGSFVLMPGYEPRAYLEALAKYRCTYSRGVAAVFTMFLQHRDLVAKLDLSGLKSMTIGSAVVTHELMDEVERALPGIKVGESYGLTEGGSPFRPPVDGRPVPRGSPGVQAPEYGVRLVGADGRDRDDEGELWLKSPYNCLGYHKRPQVTRDKLVDGWLRTGDVFRRDNEGFYYFKTRVDDMFSCGGENIYPKEVEDLLFRHPAVANAVVAPVPHAVKGFVPAALVVLKKDCRASAEEIRDYCLENGPKYAHPRFVRIIGEKDLPLNGAGKIDRGLARVRLAELVHTGQASAGT